GDIHFKSKGLLGHHGAAGKVNHVYGLAAVAILILLTAGFNFMNITTAPSLMRNKEVGVRKVLGVGRGTVLSQYLGESILFSLLGLLFGMIIVLAISQIINVTFGNIFDFSFLEFLLILGSFVLISVFFGLLAGFYPALLISRFHPISILKGNISKNL